MRSILGIDSAGPHGSVALLLGDAIAGNAVLLPGGHSGALAAAVESLVREAGIPLAGLSGIAVSSGPGSFTGLRIGLAWAKGVAVAAGVPLALVSAHEAAAHAASDATGLRITLTPGERRAVAIAVWEAPDAADAGARPAPLAPPRSTPEIDLSEAIEAAAAGRPYTALPSNEAIAALLDADEIPHIAPRPLAASVARIGDLLLRSGAAADIVAAAPDYGRAPNARKPTT